MRAFGSYRALQIVGFSTSADPFIFKYALSKNLLLDGTLFSETVCVLFIEVVSRQCPPLFPARKCNFLRCHATLPRLR